MSQRRQRSANRENEAKGLSPARVAAGAGLALSASLAVAAPAQAADFTVTNLDPEGPGSLRDAIDQANLAAGDDRVLFQAGLTGAINLNESPGFGYTGQIDITDSVDILGPGLTQIAVDANAESRVFYIDSEQEGRISVTIDALQIRQGNLKYGEQGPPFGGNIFNAGENLTITNSSIRSGVAVFGGGIFNSGGLVISNSTISGNAAGLVGGGIATESYGETDGAIITGSTLNNNSVSNQFFFPFFPENREAGDQKYGGGAIAADGDLIVLNSTLTGNGTAGQGGGILFGDGEQAEGELTVQSATISGNGAGAGAGIYSYSYEEEQPPARRAPGDTTIGNSIVAGNEADEPARGHDLGGGPFAVGYSLIGDPTGADITPTTADSNIFGLDPLLGALAPNGGPTRTMKLHAGSPALDAGRTPANLVGDQRGEDRPVDLRSAENAAGGDGADMGAYERQAVPVVPPPEPTGSCQGVDATLSGTNDRDFLRGTPQRDVIRAGGGNDVVRGLGGNDLICLGAGIDVGTGGLGRDRIFGQAGNDRIFGQEGGDYGEGGTGADILAGGEQADELHGNAQKDRVLGAEGNDRLFGEGADDVILGATGNDFIRGGPGQDRLSGGRGINDVQQ